MFGHPVYTTISSYSKSMLSPLLQPPRRPITDKQRQHDWIIASYAWVCRRIKTQSLFTLWNSFKFANFFSVLHTRNRKPNEAESLVSVFLQREIIGRRRVINRTSRWTQNTVLFTVTRLNRTGTTILISIAISPSFSSWDRAIVSVIVIELY